MAAHPHRGGDALHVCDTRRRRGAEVANEAEDQTALSRLAAVLEAPDPDFAIVIP